MANRKSMKRGQIAMWVILAVFLVASIALFFFVQRKPIIKETSIKSPESFLEECVREEVLKNADLILLQGGFLEPRNYKQYNKAKIEYLCDQAADYKTCIQQHPALLKEINDQLYDKVNWKLEQCFQLFKEESEKRSEKIALGPQSINLSIADEKINVNIARRVEIVKDKNKISYDKFDFDIPHPIYALAKVAMEISNQEAVYCYFDAFGYTIFEPKFSIKKILLSDNSNIYTITDKKFNKTMLIAIKSCVIPGGVKLQH